VNKRTIVLAIVFLALAAAVSVFATATSGAAASDGSVVEIIIDPGTMYPVTCAPGDTPIVGFGTSNDVTVVCPSEPEPEYHIVCAPPGTLGAIPFGATVLVDCLPEEKP